ncbi:hypothetical protein J6590_057196, partial [Homalodisca vitripennis]
MRYHRSEKRGRGGTLEEVVFHTEKLQKCSQGLVRNPHSYVVSDTWQAQIIHRNNSLQFPYGKLIQGLVVASLLRAKFAKRFTAATSKLVLCSAE